MLNHALFFDNEVQWEFPLDNGEFEVEMFMPDEYAISLNADTFEKEQIHIGKLRIKRLYGGN